MNKVTSFLGGLIVIALGVVFLFQFRPGSGQSTANADVKCVAEVHGECIPHSHYRASMRLLASNRDQNWVQAMGVPKLVLEGLVERQLLLGDAERLGLTVSDEEVTNELSSGRFRVSIPTKDQETTGPRMFGLIDGDMQFFELKKADGAFESKHYERRVREISGLSPTEFREYQTKEILASRMRSLVRSRAHISVSEAFDYFASQNSTARARYVNFSRKFYGERLLDRSPEAVEKWASANKDEVNTVFEGRKVRFTPECRIARQIRVAKGLPEQGEDFEAPTARAKKKIDAAVERVKAGEDFAAVASEVSDDPSAAVGGELGCIAKSQSPMPKPLEDAVFAITADGGMTEVIATEDDFHVVKVEKILKDAAAEEAGLAQTKLELYLAKESERLAAEAAKSVLAARQGGKTLEEAVEAHLAEIRPKLRPRRVKGATPPPTPAGTEPKKDEPKKDEPKKDEPKKDGTEPAKDGAPKQDEPKKDEPKKDEPKKDGAEPAKDGAPKTDEPKKDEPKKDGAEPAKDGAPKTDAPKTDAPKTDGPDEDPDMPRVSTTLAFTEAKEPLPDAKPGSRNAPKVFKLKNPGDVVNDIIPTNNGYAILELKEKTLATEEQFKADGEGIRVRMRSRKEQESLMTYVKRMREAAAAEIKKDPKYEGKQDGSPDQAPDLPE